MIEQTHNQIDTPFGHSNPEAVFRGYFEDLNKPAEIIPPNQAKQTIENELNEQLPKSDLDESLKRKVEDITFTCLKKLDQNQILSGHIRGIVRGFIPALLNQNDCVKSFFDTGAFIKGFEHEADGISVNDFIFQSLTRKCKPSNFSRLVYRSKKMPAIDSQKILQNRKDGILLGKEVHFNALRELIHDQKSISIPIVRSMIDFYETGDDTNLQLETQRWKLRYPDDDVSPLFERYLYDLVIQENRNGSTIKLRTVDVLYRLQENLSFIGFEPPITPNEELNESLKKTSANFSYPSIESLDTYEKPLILLNSILINAIDAKQIGIDPSYMATSNWLRERIGKILGGLSFESIEKLYFQKSLKETLRLMELTASSSKYNQEDFESFVSKYQSQQSLKDTYDLIFNRSKNRQSQTFSYFKENASSIYKFGGNLTASELSLGNENIEKQLQLLRDLFYHKPTTLKGRDRYYTALGMQ